MRSLRIVYLVAGAGPIYCGACARDMALIRGLRAAGHEVHTIPLYTPLRIEDEEPFDTAPLHLGGLNAYLQQASPLFARLPAGLRRLLDHPRLISAVSRFAVSVDASDLGAMTVSVLQGREGRQRREVERLMGHLQAESPADVFIITNALLLSLAPELKRHFTAPVLCGIQGEESFVQALGEPHARRAMELMRRHAESVDLFLSPSESCLQGIAPMVSVPPDRARVVRTGPGAQYSPCPRRCREPFTIGYLGAIIPAKGLDVLVDAWMGMAEAPELVVAGKVMNPRYSRDLARRAAAQEPPGLTYLGELSLAEKLAFLYRCSVFVMPSRIAECRGMAALEALACGVPVIAPASGAFPEMAELTGGVLLYEPGKVEELRERLTWVREHPDEADEMGRRGAEGVKEEYSNQRACEVMEGILGEMLGKDGQPST